MKSITWLIQPSKSGSPPAVRAQQIVSIHAPAWGATCLVRRAHSAVRRFNPRPRMGGDLLGASGALGCPPFQSTPPHGGRLPSYEGTKRSKVFQSTPPHGGRPVPKIHRSVGQAFQSTPPHGGRRWLGGMRTFCAMFQSTPPHGGRRNRARRIANGIAVSIHAPAWGATRGRIDQVGRGGFNPRPRMGGDLEAELAELVAGVSIHAPAWGATAEASLVVIPHDVSIHAPAWGAT